MTDYCKYHPKQKASWFCANCDTAFCNTCTPKDEENYFPKCVLCRRSLRSLSIANTIKPFWQNLAAILSIPLTTAPLLFIIIFAFIFSLLPTGKVGAILFLLFTMPLIEFLLKSMEQVASGESVRAKVTQIFNLKSDALFLKLLVAYVLCVLVVAKLYAFSPVFGILLGAFLILGTPASFIILMMEKSMLEMFNPAKVIYIIKLFGGAYFLLYGIIFGVVGLSIESYQIALTSPSFLASMLVNSLILYLTVTVFVMAGYLVFQYHQELSFSINRQVLHDITPDLKPDDMSEVNIFVQEGRFEDAQKILLDRINNHSLDYKANEKLILLYAIQEKPQFLDKIAQSYFTQLVQAGKQKHAADFYQKLQSKSIQFIPEKAKVVAAICGEMKNKSQFKIALSLIDAFLENNKMPENWESLYLVHSQLLAEFANRADEAREKLSIIMRRSLDQDWSEQAENYQRFLDQT
ncbi:hypothetical protein [Aliikangiella coralliicola]|uniref:B box-type domain-containing protein n=1 Tax=Aliikangiella coralliicola TaxID=2592383 RepID=A0A545UAU5_9GAMM|nr:hypothetical protein [Aliikangiella coralliicola]TQV86585.1 hypothetical protein FLL46_16940 [Aliikangiella coralliicola]